MTRIDNKKGDETKGIGIRDTVGDVYIIKEGNWGKKKRGKSEGEGRNNDGRKMVGKMANRTVKPVGALGKGGGGSGIRDVGI